MIASTRHLPLQQQQQLLLLLLLLRETGITAHDRQGRGALHAS
jgi:hypothetical protein